MKRLTEPGYEYHSCDFMDDGIYIDMNRLREYEDTGLTPDEINALRERDTAKAIVVDDMTGGIKLYSCPICDTPVHEKDNFCPECGQRLKLATETQRPEWKDRMLHTFLGGHHD